LIVKLGAAGDVLRTTALLGSIREMSPRAHITWVCGQKSISLIRHNPLIDRPLPLTPETIAILEGERFDRCINFDLAPEATALTMKIQAGLFQGYGRKEDGSVFPFDTNGEEWLEMSLWDDNKKANRKTYQTHMRRLIGAPETNHPIIVPLLPDKTALAKEFARKHDLTPDRPVIGFNVGAGERWEYKKWTVEGFVRLGEMIHRERLGRVVILYGPADYERAQEVMSAMTAPFIDAELRASVLEFAAILNLCDLVVSGDTLALHAALGLGKRVVCLVGPTSAAELELYGQGVILQGEIDCLGCYLTRCDREPNCMKSLPAEKVFDAVKQPFERV